MQRKKMPVPDGNFAVVTGFTAVEGRDPKDFANKVREMLPAGWQPWGVPFVVPSALGQPVYAGFMVRREIATDVAARLVKNYMGLAGLSKDPGSAPQEPFSAPPPLSEDQAADKAPSDLKGV